MKKEIAIYSYDQGTVDQLSCESRKMPSTRQNIFFLKNSTSFVKIVTTKTDTYAPTFLLLLKTYSVERFVFTSEI